MIADEKMYFQKMKECFNPCIIYTYLILIFYKVVHIMYMYEFLVLILGSLRLFVDMMNMLLYPVIYCDYMYYKTREVF